MRIEGKLESITFVSRGTKEPATRTTRARNKISKYASADVGTVVDQNA